jgi:hypothetical protein
MNHADVREQLELAAAEPAGLDRLGAGDTPEAVLVASHLAGCPSCLDELSRLRRTTGLIREVVLDEGEELEDVVLPPELRERTLAYVRELGVSRPMAPAAATTGGLAPTAGALASGAAIDRAPSAAAPVTGARRFARRAAWIASIAAAVVISVVATSVLLGGRGATSAGLAEVAGWTADVAAAPDAREVALKSVDTGIAKGGITLAPSSHRLVVVVRGLAAAPSGREYRCWLETSVGRTWVGKMFFEDDISYWVGPVPSLAAVPAGTVFGISLEDAGGTSIGGPAVLHGTL